MKKSKHENKKQMFQDRLEQLEKKNLDEVENRGVRFSIQLEKKVLSRRMETLFGENQMDDVLLDQELAAI